MVGGETVERVTIREVAAMAGVAVSTVSAVLNDTGGARVASATRARVLEAVDLLGYQPHHAARALRGKSSGCLVLVDDDVSTGPYGGQMLAGVHDVCEQLGVPVVGLRTGGDPRREQEGLRYAASLGALAVVVASVSEAVRTLPVGVRGVLLNGRSPTDEVPGVVPDNERGPVEVARELVDDGHRRVGVVTIGPCEPADQRLEAVRQAVGERWGPAVAAEVPVVRMANVEATADGGREAGRRMLAGDDPPTAVVCFNDRMAMGVYQAAAERGLRVPADLSVVGFDDAEPVAESLDPGLTTVALPHREMGELAAVLALDAETASGPAGAPLNVSYSAAQLTRTGSTVRVLCPVVRRGSVGPPRVAQRLVAGGGRSHDR
jgi:LacI family transcriptional regulator